MTNFVKLTICLGGLVTVHLDYGPWSCQLPHLILGKVFLGKEDSQSAVSFKKMVWAIDSGLFLSALNHYLLGPDYGASEGRL